MTAESSPEDAAALIEQLHSFDQQLTLREQGMLRSLLASAIQPAERDRLLGQNFSDDQLAILHKLEGTS